MLGVRQFDHFQRDAASFRIVRHLLARIPLIDVRQRHLIARLLLHPSRQVRDHRTILDVGGRDVEREQMPQRVHGEMHLAAPLALVAIIPRAYAAIDPGEQRARAEDRRRARRRADGGEAQEDAQIVGDGLEDARSGPALGLRVDCLPRREIMGQQASTGPGTVHPAHDVEDCAQVVVTSGSIEAHQGQIGNDEGPFVTADGRRVGFACRIHPSSIRHRQVYNTL